MTTSSSSSFKQLLTSLLTDHTVGDVLKASRGDGASSAAHSLVTVNDSDTLEHASRALSEARVLSAPVRVQGACKCFLDTSDVAAVVVQRGVNALANMCVHDAVNASRHDVFFPVPHDVSALHVTQLFTRGVHRVPLVDEQHVVNDVVSQSDVVAFVHSKLTAEHVLLANGISVDSLGVASTHVLSVPPTASLREAVTKCCSESVDALAIVDADEKFIGTFSTTDLLGVHMENLEVALDDSVLDFLHASGGPAPCSTLSPSDGLGDALALLRGRGVHRVWLTKEAGMKPVGVLTLSDVMRSLLLLTSSS